MLKIKFLETGSIENDNILFAVIAARYKGKWIFVRHKERRTWEIPGGHREISEDINDTAARELFEETGAKEFKLYPVSLYSVEREGEKSYGQFFYAEVEVLGRLPDSEIAEIQLSERMPDELTYPAIQPVLYEKATAFMKVL